MFSETFKTVISQTAAKQIVVVDRTRISYLLFHNTFDCVKPFQRCNPFQDSAVPVQWCSLEWLSRITCCRKQKQQPEVFHKKDVLKNLAKFTGKHPCWSLFLMKLQALTRNFIKKRLQQRYFSMNIAKLLRTPILKNTSGRLVLRKLTLSFQRSFSVTLKTYS